MWGCDSTDWLIARTLRHYEEKASVHATRQGCQCFLPMVYNEHTERESIFFPGFLFLRTPTPSIAFLDSTFGISQVMRFGETIATVSDIELRQLFDRTIIIGGSRSRAVVLPAFKPGEMLRMRCGSFAGDHVEFQRYRGKQVEILLQFLGRKIAITVPKHWVEAA